MKRLTEKPVEWCGWKCHIDAGQYDNGRIALELVVAKEHDEGIEGGRICTTNLPDEPLGPRSVFVKDYSENAGMVEWLIKQDIIEPQALDKVESGFVIIRSYRLTAPVFAKLCGDPAPVVVQYLVSLTLTPGLTANDAPAEDAVLGALEVGTEGAPDGMRFEGVEEICVEDHVAPSYHLDDREHATVLAALRYWQAQREEVVAENDIATNGGTVLALTAHEIDALCERLNCGG